MPTDRPERILIRLVILAVIIFCAWATIRNFQAVSVDASRSVPVYWCAMFFILVVSTFSLVWSWRNIQVALVVFGWSTLVGITAMALYDARHTSEVWSVLIYFQAVVSIGAMSFYVGGRHAMIYGIALSVIIIIEGFAYRQNIHAIGALGLTWGAWAGTWAMSHRFGRLQRRSVKQNQRIVQLEGANDIYSGFILGEMESEV